MLCLTLTSRSVIARSGLLATFFSAALATARRVLLNEFNPMQKPTRDVNLSITEGAPDGFISLDLMKLTFNIRNINNIDISYVNTNR